MTGGSASVLLSVLDWTVVAVYVGGLVVFGLLLSRKHLPRSISFSRRARRNGP